MRGYRDIEPSGCISSAGCISFWVATYKDRFMLSSTHAVDRESRGGRSGWFCLKDSLKGPTRLGLKYVSCSVGFSLVWVALHGAASTKANSVRTQTRSPHLGSM